MSDDARLDSMAAPAFEHVYPWTEEEFFALGETSDRVELFDGSLLVSPAPTVRHQVLGVALRNALHAAALQAGLEIYLAVNVRLRTGRVPISDLVIAQPVDLDTLVIEVRTVALVCEITSTNAATDRVLKMHYYSAAHIPFYLLVDPPAPTLQLFRLDGDHYVEEQKAGPGETLRFTAPIVTELDPASLGQ
jgi:Uma2 family endonuclease